MISATFTKKKKIRIPIKTETYQTIIVGLVILIGLYITTFYNYLLFHCLAEIFSVAISLGIFMFAWNTRRFLENDYLLFLGIAYLFVGFLDLIHTLSYTGMNIFHGYETNLTVQLWIIARYLESLTFLSATFFLKKKLNPQLYFLTFLCACILALVSTFYWQNFPICFIDGEGLTLFKKVSEYIISMILMITLILLYQTRSNFNFPVFQLLMVSVAITIVSEMAFTLYVHTYGLFNLMGHYLKIISFYLIYRAIIATGLKQPYDLLFRSLKQKERALVNARDQLEHRVQERTKKLFSANKQLQQEIAERMYAEKALSQAQKLESVGRLAGGVAHDLNNLLSPIIGYSEIVLEDIPEEDPNKESMSEILNAGIRARNLVRQLLAFSRKQILSFKPIDLNLLLVDFEKLLHRTIREDISIKLKLSENLPLIQGDVGQLEQVIMNFAVNAQDAMTKGGELTIETTFVDLDKSKCEEIPIGSYIILIISDTGCGMDETTQRYLFEPFFTTKDKDKGTGLGLATVYGIIKQHGGHILFYSEQGIGSTFRVYIPVTKVTPRCVEPVIKERPVADGSETILVVEDNKQVRNLALKILKRKGYITLSAKNGKEALTILNDYNGPLHLILTDVIMPKMNGKELFERVLELFPNIRALYMSGYPNNVIAPHGVLDKDIHFIQKPFNIKTLSLKVREVLDP